MLRAGTRCGAALLLLLLAASVPGLTNAQSSIWTWKCEAGVCNRKLFYQGDAPQCLSVCKMLCDPYAALWPRPTGKVTVSPDVVTIDPNKVTLESNFSNHNLISGTIKSLEEMIINLVTKLPQAKAAEEVNEKVAPLSKSLRIILDITKLEILRPAYNVDESYELQIFSDDGSVTATISSPTYFGAHNGVESLLQLVVWCDLEHRVVMPSSARLQDAPKYAHRGLLLDTARNYFSPASIKRTIDAMGAVKLNTFHWHITDSHSFPFVAKSKPELSQLGAYSPEQIYTPEVVSEIVEYARVRGVRVIPEFSAPAHVGEGWQWSEKENMILCFNAEPWQMFCKGPPCGQLNPYAEGLYPVLRGIYRDMLDAFDSDIFYMGGNEINFNCWNSSRMVVDAMAKLGYGRSREGFIRVWADFQQRALDELTAANQGKQLPVVIWNNFLTWKGQVDKYLDPRKYIIQIWSRSDDTVIGELLSKGYRLILSNHDGLYLKCGSGAWVREDLNWCSPNKEWQKVYENRPTKIIEKQGLTVKNVGNLILGAEVILTSEHVDEQALDSKLWPRTAALAERLWSDPAEGWRSAEMRMVHVRERLVKRGVAADSIKPRWCHQNDEKCHL